MPAAGERGRPGALASSARTHLELPVGRLQQLLRLVGRAACGQHELVDHDLVPQLIHVHRHGSGRRPLPGSAAAGGRLPSARARRRPRPPDPRPPRRPPGECCGPARAAGRHHKQQCGAGPCVPTFGGREPPPLIGPRRSAGARLPGRRSIRILRPAGPHCFSFCLAAPIGGRRLRGAPRHWPDAVFWLVLVHDWPRPGVWGGAARADWSPLDLFELNLKTLGAC